MEFVLAGAARHAGQRLVDRMKDRIANGAFFDTVKHFFDRAAPSLQGIAEAAVLCIDHGSDGEQPSAGPTFFDARLGGKGHFDGDKGVGSGEFETQHHLDFVFGVRAPNFTGGCQATNAQATVIIVILGSREVEFT